MSRSSRASCGSTEARRRDQAAVAGPRGGRQMRRPSTRSWPSTGPRREKENEWKMNGNDSLSDVLRGLKRSLKLEIGIGSDVKRHF